MKLDDKGGDLTAIAEFMNNYQCDLVGFSEINLDVSKYRVKRIFADTLNRSFEANQISTSTSEIPFDTFYKPGGTMTAIFNDSVSRWLSKYSDTMGRWSTISMTGQRGRIIHFITVYQVVNNKTTSRLAKIGRQDRYTTASVRKRPEYLPSHTAVNDLRIRDHGRLKRSGRA